MKSKIALITGIFAIAGVLMASAATVNAKNKTVVPGWGHGDKNHVHVGPPGQSVRP